MIQLERFHEYVAKPELFRADLVIDAGGTPRPFGEVAHEFQLEDFRATDPGWKACRSINPTAALSAKNRAWIGRPRGHAKSSDIGIRIVESLFLGQRPFIGVLAAADGDQAAYPLDQIRLLLKFNPALEGVIQVGRNFVRNVRADHPAEGAEVKVITSDAPTSYGLLADFILCDELVHWRGPELWESLFSAAAKRESCMLQVCTNAGLSIDNLWSYRARETARQSDLWYWAELDGPQPGVMSAATIEEQRLMLSPISFARYILNQWRDSAEHPLLPPEVVARAIGRCLWRDHRGDDAKPGPGAELYLGIDIGRTRDRTVIITLERQGQRVVIRELKVLHNTPFAIQRDEICRRIVPQVRRVGIDRGGIGYQLHEELVTKYGSRVEGFQLNSAVQGKVATRARTLFDRQAVTICDDPDLCGDLQLIEACENANGVPVIRTGRSTAGHGDRAWAMFLGLAVLPTTLDAKPIGAPVRAAFFGSRAGLGPQDGLPYPIMPGHPASGSVPRAFGGFN